MVLNRAERAIPLDVAAAFCREVCRKYDAKGGASQPFRCKLCRALAGGNPRRMRFASKPGNRGCRYVNALYAERVERWQPRGGRRP